MVRIYRVVAHLARAQYEAVDYFLDPSKAAGVALQLSRTIPADSYYLVQQIDVYPASCQVSQLLRVDGTA